MKIAHAALALEASDAGVWEWEVGSPHVYWDRRLRELMGVSPEGPITFDTYLKLIHPEDLPRAEELLALINDEPSELNWKSDLRFKHPTRGIRWLHGRGRIERDAHGIAQRILGISIDITDSKLAEESLRNSEEELRRFKQSLLDAYLCVDRDGKVVDSNQTLCALLGYQPHELSQLICAQISDSCWGKIHQLFYEEREDLGDEHPAVHEESFTHRDGTEIPAETRLFVIRDESRQPYLIWGIVRDISLRKAAEETMRQWNQALERNVAERTLELKQSHERFRQLAAAAFEGIAICDGEMIIDGNPQLSAMHHCELRQMIGRPLSDYVTAEFRATLETQLRVGISQSFECRGLRADGSQFPQEIRVSAGTWQSREIRFVAFRDLTSIKQTAAKLRNQQSELERSQRIGLVSEISAGVIHQIGQPLSALGANLATLCKILEDEINPTAVSIASDLQADVRRLRDIVHHLRELANPEGLRRQACQITEIITDVVSLIRQDAETLDIAVTVVLSDDLPKVYIDPVQIGQALLNLLRNALDACAEQSMRPREITIEAGRAERQDKPQIEITVTDSGHGITQTAREKLFQAFFTTKSNGLGMGLRLSQTIVAAHGGTISGETNPTGSGARFCLTLPISSVQRSQFSHSFS